MIANVQDADNARIAMKVNPIIPLALMMTMGLFLVTDAAVGQTITIWPESVVASETVTLGDICRISEADQATIQMTSAAPIVEAPRSGESTVISMDQIRSALRRAGVNLATATIMGASKCEVRRPDLIEQTQEAPQNSGPENRRPSTDQPRTLRDFVIEYFAKRAAFDHGRIETTFGRVDRAILDLSEPGFSFSIRQTSGRRLGLVGVEVDIFSEGRLLRTERMALTVSLIRKVVIADRPINRGATVRPADVRVVERRFQRLADLGLRDPAAAIGQQAKRFIPKSEIVMYSDLKPSPLVKRGQVVEVRSQSGAVAIVTAAKALNEGAYGEVVNLRYAGRRDHTMQGVVVGPGKVTIGALPETTTEQLALNRKGG